MKRDIGYILFSMLMAVVVLTACGGSDIIDDDNNVDAPKPLATSNEEIRVKTNIASMMTRATVYDNSNLQSENILINAYYYNTNTKYLDDVKLHYDSSWKFWSNGEPGSQVHYYWPIEGSVYDPSSANITVSSLDFVGYCPFSTPSYITTPTYNHSTHNITFTATMPTTTIETIDYMDSQADFKEFMYAIALDQTKNTNSGTVNMTFKHPFAYVKFNLSSATTKNVTVNEITINDLKTSGSCSFNGTTSTWSGQSGEATMKLTEVLHRDTREATSPFLVIPNDYGETQKTLTVKIEWREWDEVHNYTFTTPLDINWAAGYSYTYSLTITKDDLKVDIEKFTEQW